MKLRHVTITGADDSTDIDDLVKISAEYPFVEWGILLSGASAGHKRFPSHTWMELLEPVVLEHGLNIAVHICGRWTRNLLVGDLDWSGLPALVNVAKRIQINTHAESSPSSIQMIENLIRHQDKELIFQFDGVNDHLIYAAQAYRFKVSALFDKSGGAGVLPAWWPSSATHSFPCGYAGGLGPANILTQLSQIATVVPDGYVTWVDMERNVRTPDDSSLNMSAVRVVLEQVGRHGLCSINS